MGTQVGIEKPGEEKPPAEPSRGLRDLRKDAFEIFRAGLDAVIPQEAIHRHVKLSDGVLRVGVKSFHLKDFRHVWLVGVGKAGASMAQAVEEILGKRLDRGVVVVNRGHRTELKRVQLIEAGHPLPDEDGVRGAQEIVKLLTSAAEDDMVICLISGGGSALLPLPAEGITLADKQRTTDLLLKCGATIQEINAIRKHISRVKGGQLARIASPARMISLVLSDVVGDRLDAIASGPTVPDETSYGDCFEIIDRYALQRKLPLSVWDHLQRGARGEIPETPKPGDPVFAKTETHIVGSNLLALRGSEKRARELGYTPLILSSFMEGETREVAKVHAAMALEVQSSKHPVSAPACLLSGGETTVTVKGNGFGGRNQEFVLACALKIDGTRDVVILSCGTDGTDGPTDAAGAIADGDTVSRGREKEMDAQGFLDRNDSYHFFKRLDDLVITGPTQTNVMDLRILLIG